MASSKQQRHSSQSDTAVHFNLNAMLLPVTATDTTWNLDVLIFMKVMYYAIRNTYTSQRCSKVKNGEVQTY